MKLIVTKQAIENLRKVIQMYKEDETEYNKAEQMSKLTNNTISIKDNK
jgi:hypothetical protein